MRFRLHDEIRLVNSACVVTLLSAAQLAQVRLTACTVVAASVAVGNPEQGPNAFQAFWPHRNSEESWLVETQKK
jgi:hypothetical protein